MNKLTIDLKNCYGIKSLKHEFDFTTRSVYAIYAPNGCMKSSLALTMKDIANPKDRVRPDAISACHVLDEAGQLLSQDNISVLASYRDPLADVASAAVLLANPQLRAQFNLVNSERDKAQEALVKQLKTQSDCKLVEKELVSSFLGREPRDSTDFCVAIGRLDRELRDLVDTHYAEIPYDTIFDEKVLQLLQEPAVKADLEDFIAQYDDLISASIYFKKGMFEYYNASTLAKNLEDQGFFKAKHFVTLNGTERIEITSRPQLEQIIAAEMEKISNDPDLRGRFEKVEKRLTANITFKAFREYILNNNAVLSKMADVLNFKQEVWKSYLKTHIVHVNDLMAKYDAAKDQNAKILDQAKQEQTYWESVLETFKDRFVVPFELKVKNRENIVGGDEEIVPSLVDAAGSRGTARYATWTC